VLRPPLPTEVLPRLSRKAGYCCPRSAGADRAVPAEIGTLKARFGAVGASAVRAREWLAGMMANACPRESVLLEEDAKRPRYPTIASDWIGHSKPSCRADCSSLLSAI
jgi:hypothetical protein